MITDPLLEPIGGVNAYILTPDSIPEANRNRLLVHVHGGGYVFAPAESATREAVLMAGFGKFKVKQSSARQGRNPATGETIEIAASRKLGFAPAKQVKDALAG